MKVFIKESGNNILLHGGYHPKLIEIYQALPGYFFNPEEQTCSFPLVSKTELISKVVAIGVSVEEVKEFVNKKQRKKAIIKNTEDSIEIYTKYMTKEVFFLI